MIFILALVSSCILLVGIFWFSHYIAGYSHVQHTISELGETGSRWSAHVSWGCFAPVGIGLLTLSLLLTTSTLPSPLVESFALLTAAVGIGYLGAALFPCDPGSPLAGSWRQNLHNLVGGVEYVGGAIALFVASQSLLATQTSAFLQTIVFGSAVVVAMVAVLLSFPNGFQARGAIQRVGEFVLFANILLLSVLISTGS